MERLFGTLQDRLVVELRLAGASTLQQANQVLVDYLPCFNARAEVEVHEHLVGSLGVYYGTHCLLTSPAPAVAAELRARKGRRGAAQPLQSFPPPSSAVVLLTPASTAELGESTARSAKPPTAPGPPASTHPWRRPLFKPKRSNSLNT